MDDILIGAVALLLPNEVIATDAFASSPFIVQHQSDSALFDAAVESTSQGQRTVAARRRHRRAQNHQAEAVIPPYRFLDEWLGSSR